MPLFIYNFPSWSNHRQQAYFDRSRTLYNGLLDDDDQPLFSGEHITNPAAIFVRYSADKILGTNFENLTLRRAKITEIRNVDRADVHGHIFALTAGGLCAYEFQDGPPPPSLTCRALGRAAWRSPSLRGKVHVGARSRPGDCNVGFVGRKNPSADARHGLEDWVGVWQPACLPGERNIREDDHRQSLSLQRRDTPSQIDSPLTHMTHELSTVVTIPRIP
ncbi:uncharacterized protein MKZ38_000734 [Zalerion maritima]|uniref:Uncharacterized protein n=1 Tax=Zalerion maritima TaxID=339359 RepID=A0AAD5RFG8_9PEZI|nr:uncharacterized protein MKZ38_000734 [Zalerion maritima]